MEDAPRILVATDSPDDAELVCKLLAEAYPVVAQSVKPDRFAADFAECRPQVLVLAYKSLEAAESHYLGLYRTSSLVAEVPHRTLVLCGKEDVPRAYAQCCKGHFDDYILFWPMVHDAKRLPMSVRLALRAMEATRGDAALARFGGQARRIADLEVRLDREIAQGQAHANRAEAVVQRARHQADDAVPAAGGDPASKRLAGGATDSSGNGAVPAAATPGGDLRRSLDGVAQAIQPIQTWIGGLKSELAGPLEAIHELSEHVRSLSRLVLVVDDDAFMRDLVTRVLTSAGYEVKSAATVDEMLAAVRSRRPHLIIMDVMLPDVDGVAGTRKLKAIPTYAQIPVIMLTGQQNRQIIVDSLQAGAVDYVVKPFDRNTLLKKVERRVAS